MAFEFPNPFKKKKQEEYTPMETRLPSELEQFRLQRQEPMPAREEPAPFTGQRMLPPAPSRQAPMQSQDDFPTLERLEPTELTSLPEPARPIRSVAPEPREEPKESFGMSSSQKLDMILQKLETIDTRIKLLEERSK